MTKITKIRREKAPNEGYNYLRFLANYTLNELRQFTLRQLYDAEEKPDVERREMKP
jgi:hypothetical protein